MKKILLIFTLLFISTINTTNINGRSNYSAIIIYNNLCNLKKEKQIMLEKRHKIINTIEFISEVKIPKYVDTIYIEYLYDKANEFQLPIRTVFRLVFKESSFIHNNVSSEGAKGFFQLMPETESSYAKMLNIDTLNLDYNRKNIYIGLIMLKNLHDYWHKKYSNDKYSWKLALASYNAGIGKVFKFRGVPPFPETINYVNFILKKHSNSKYYLKKIKRNENKA